MPCKKRCECEKVYRASDEYSCCFVCPTKGCHNRCIPRGIDSSNYKMCPNYLEPQKIEVDVTGRNHYFHVRIGGKEYAVTMMEDLNVGCTQNHIHDMNGDELLRNDNSLLYDSIIDECEAALVAWTMDDDLEDEKCKDKDEYGRCGG